ncbi:MAG: methionine adenosyltransferase [Lysobacterales bacterium]|nr:MAG: methionine adenosyltransferase [Xanthomonadales bacterium]
MTNSYLFTSESVTEGHPDKVADQISDAVLDAVLTAEPRSFVACETLVAKNACVLAGEIGWPGDPAQIDYENIARQTIRRIGYDRPGLGFDATQCDFTQMLHDQSADIRRGVLVGGAGDQGMMFGYATDETESYMPMPISLAHRLTRRLAEVRHSGELPWLRPDGKAQVTVRYVDGRPAEITTVVLSAQHDPDIDDAKEQLASIVILPALPPELFDPDRIQFHINPTGRFVTGGPYGDAGVTGRKIIVDTYGGFGSHGGGAFSGKDSSKVDRSACYAARWVALNLVAAGLASRIQVQVAYAIGVAEPVSIMVDSFGTGKHGDDRLEAAAKAVFNLTPNCIIKALDLRRPIYSRTAAYGHFGREPEADGGFSWERKDKVDELRAAVGD